MAVSQQEIQQYIQGLVDQGLSGEALNQALYNAAQQHGITQGQLGAAMGVGGDAVREWTDQQGFRPLVYSQVTRDQTYNQQEVNDKIASLKASGLQGGELNEAIYNIARQHQVGTQQIANALGVDANEINQWITDTGRSALNFQDRPGGTPLGAAPASYGDQEVEGYIQDLKALGLEGDELNQAIYDAARQYGVGIGQIANAMGISAAEVNNWITQNNLKPLEGPEYGLAATEGSLGRSRDILEAGGVRAQDYLSGAREAARGDIQTGLATARGDIQAGADAAMGRLQPFQEAGQGAFNVQAALSGAMGPEAQQQAYDNFISSPGQAWLQEQGERALTRNAAALGGLGGGNVRQELVRQGQGMAQQDFGNYYNRLAALGGQGQQAAGAMSNLDWQRGQALASPAFTAGQNLANIETGIGTNQANVARGVSQDVARTQDLLGGYQMQAGRDIAQQTGSLASQLAGMQQGMGQSDASLYGGTATGLANIYGNLGNTMGQLPLTAANYLSGIEQKYGTGVGSMYGDMGDAAAKGIAGKYKAYGDALGGMDFSGLNFGGTPAGATNLNMGNISIL